MRTDFTHSFIRNEPTAYPQNPPRPPPQEPVTSVLHFQYKDISPFSRNVEPFDDYWWIDAEGQLGRDLQRLIAAIKKQPGFDFWMFAKAEERQDERNFYLFVGWEKFPPPIFLDSQALHPDHSPLLPVVGPALQSTAELYHVPFDRPMTRMGTSYNGLSIELISWQIPSSLDPTFYRAYAKRFLSLEYMFSGLDEHPACVGPGDLVDCERGWTIQRTQGAYEPCDKTHIFMLFWKSKEDELRYKDSQEPSYDEGCHGGPRSIETHPDIWKRWYLDLRNDWASYGLSVKSVHLRFFNDDD